MSIVSSPESCPFEYPHLHMQFWERVRVESEAAYGEFAMIANPTPDDLSRAAMHESNIYEARHYLAKGTKELAKIGGHAFSVTAA